MYDVNKTSSNYNLIFFFSLSLRKKRKKSYYLKRVTMQFKTSIRILKTTILLIKQNRNLK